MPYFRLALTARCLLILAIVTHGSVYADESTNVEIRSAEQNRSDAVKTEFAAQQALNRLDVDGAKSSRIEYRQFGAKGAYTKHGVTGGLGVYSLTRNDEEFRVPGQVDKKTATFNPFLSIKTASGFGASINYAVYNTIAERENNAEPTYKLNARRPGAQVEYGNGNQLLALRYDGEARAEHDYVNPFFQLPLVDRDYVPTQVSLTWERTISPLLRTTALLRYSHYNKEVYEEQYGSSTPSKPTPEYVFDYLLSFQMSAKYTLSEKWTLAGDVLRKAALDVNSYNGDSYVLAYTGALGLQYQLSKHATLGAGTEQSRGEKEHDVQGVSYKYASRIERYSGSAAINF